LGGRKNHAGEKRGLGMTVLRVKSGVYREKKENEKRRE